MSDKMDEHIRDIAADIPERFSLAEAGVPPSIWQEFLGYAETLDHCRYPEEEISERGASLFGSSTSLEEKKKALALLAHLGTVESYRSIERYLEDPEQELKDWATAALQECRMFLENSLRDENTGMIMTGLGGVENRLRYFVMIRPGEDTGFAGAGKVTVRRAFLNACHRFDSILEEIHVHRDRATMKVLVSMDAAVGDVIEAGIRECNARTDILGENYYVTNVKVPTEEETVNLLGEIGRDPHTR